jgi:23S rRNA (guanosine2251-2'-O)-methyltransferase
MAGSKPGRPGASKGKKGPTKGTGGKNKRSLEGRGPTPKAEDRAWHPAGKRKAAAERYAAAGGKGKPAGQAQSRPRAAKKDDDTEVVTGRNSVPRSPRPRSTSRNASRWTTASKRCCRSPRTARSR